MNYRATAAAIREQRKGLLRERARAGCLRSWRILLLEAMAMGSYPVDQLHTDPHWQPLPPQFNRNPYHAAP